MDWFLGGCQNVSFNWLWREIRNRYTYKISMELLRKLEKKGLKRFGRGLL
jgi:hypothetical protein